MIDGTATWETYLRSQFPAYLLPESAAEKLSVEEATRFLAALTGKPSAFTILRNVSFLAPRLADLLGFVRRIEVFVRALPSTTETVQRHWIGGFQGKLDLRTTTMLHVQGRRTEFVTRTPRRDFDLPENVVLRGVCDRILTVLTALRNAGMLPDTGWGIGGRECEGVLRHVLATTAFRNVSSRPVDGHDLAAARAGRHPLFHEAARWHDELRSGLDDDDPARVARIVADGALLPLEAPTRFEIAVAMKLVAGVSHVLASGEWTHERSLVIAGRKDIATLRRGDITIRFFYNQAELDEGPTDLGVQHYFSNSSRMRPDVTVTINRKKELLSALVVECKHSPNKDYLISGFHEAMLYRYEYAPVLRGAVKSVVVGSSPVPGDVRAGDEVIAVTWDDWPPKEVITSIVGAAHLLGESA
jgi:hypothetical protein